MNPYQVLANAIVEQAVKDYKKFLKQYNRFPNDKEIKAEVISLENFFHSNWYGMLTDLDGEHIINSVRKMVLREVS